MENKIVVYVVDDHEIMRDGIRALLLGSNVKVKADFSNGYELFERLNHEQPDVIILDIVMQSLSGLEVLDRLNEKGFSIPVLMLSAETDERSIRMAVQKGALGFLPKDCGAKELIAAVNSVAAHKNYFGSSILSFIFNDYVKEIVGREKEIILDDRDIAIVKCLCEGMSHKEIGKQLFISHRTVETAKKQIFEKLNITNNIQLLKYAIKKGYVSLD